MTITTENLLQVAYLSKLNMLDSDLAVHTQQMNKILNFIAQLNEVDTDDIKPMAHPLEMRQRLRPDEITQGDNHQQFQAIAPQVENAFYLVPTVIKPVV